MKRYLLLVTMLSVFFAACASAPGDDLTPEVTADPTLEAIEAASQSPGETFTLAIGETITLEDGGTITFTGVSEDSRCPSDLMCDAPGQIVVDLTVAALGGQSRQASLTLIGEYILSQSAAVTVGDYTIILYLVDPYPKKANDIADSEYVITLGVTSGETVPTESSMQPLGQPFALPIGEIITLEDGGIIAFDGVSEDSRCPSDVQCVWAGQVIVDLTVTSPQSQSGQVSLTLMGGQSDPILTGNYAITLLAVDPYPETSDPFDASSYVATLQVTPGGIAPTDPAPTQEVTEAGSMNLQFKLAIGETLTLADGGSITFDAVTEDSRCPTEVDCFWSGQIIIDLTITTLEGQSEQVSLTLIQEKSDPATVSAYIITLIRVDPYPKQPGDVDPGSYVASLQLVKQ